MADVIRVLREPRHVALLLGAGASVEQPAGYPLSDEVAATVVAAMLLKAGVARGVVRDAEARCRSRDLILEAVLKAAAVVSRAAVDRFVGRVFVGRPPNAMHACAAGLINAGATCLTVNFDDGIEQAARALGQPLSVALPRALLPIGPTVVKLHGGPPGRATITIQDFARTPDARWRAGAFEHETRGRELVAVGYRDDDIDITPLIARARVPHIWWITPHGHPPEALKHRVRPVAASAGLIATTLGTPRQRAAVADDRLETAVAGLVDELSRDGCMVASAYLCHDELNAAEQSRRLWHAPLAREWTPLKYLRLGDIYRDRRTFPSFTAAARLYERVAREGNTAQRAVALRALAAVARGQARHGSRGKLPTMRRAIRYLARSVLAMMRTSDASWRAESMRGERFTWVWWELATWPKLIAEQRLLRENRSPGTWVLLATSVPFHLVALLSPNRSESRSALIGLADLASTVGLRCVASRLAARPAHEAEILSDWETQRRATEAPHRLAALQTRLARSPSDHR